MPRAQSTSPWARWDQRPFLTFTQSLIQRKLRLLSSDIFEHLRQLRLLAGLSLSPDPPPDSKGLMRQMMYIGLGEVGQEVEVVDGIHHPRFGDLGRIQYKKPEYKVAPTIVWDPVYIPRTLLESDTELLRLLTERARLTAEWETTYT